MSEFSPKKNQKYVVSLKTKQKPKPKRFARKVSARKKVAGLEYFTQPEKSS